MTKIGSEDQSIAIIKFVRESASHRSNDLWFHHNFPSALYRPTIVKIGAEFFLPSYASQFPAELGEPNEITEILGS